MRAVFVPTIVSIAAPTAAEITAGTNLTPDLADLAGFGFESSQIDVPDMASPSQKQIPGANQLSPGELTIYEQKTPGTNPLLATLAKGVVGHVVIAPSKAGGVIATDKVEVWPVEVASLSRNYGSDAKGATYTIKLTITEEPNQYSIVA